MKTIDTLTTEDFIAFYWRYSSDYPQQIEVAKITSIQEDDALVHFLWGYKSIAEYIKKSDIIAIGNALGKTKLEGWSGKFDLVNYE